jgi:hypothetical protein
MCYLLRLADALPILEAAMDPGAGAGSLISLYVPQLSRSYAFYAYANYPRVTRIVETDCAHAVEYVREAGRGLMARVCASVPPLLSALYPVGYVSGGEIGAIGDDVMDVLYLAFRVRPPSVDEVRSFDPETSVLLDTSMRIKKAKVIPCVALTSACAPRLRKPIVLYCVYVWVIDAGRCTGILGVHAHPRGAEGSLW